MQLATRTHRDAGVKMAYNAILYGVEKDDLIWFRDWLGFYYLARVTGEWSYEDSADAIAADLVNLRSVIFHKIGTQVPGGVKNQFIRGQTLRQIRNATLQRFSVYVASKIWQEPYSTVLASLPRSADIFYLLDPFDIEDLVGLYLQDQMDYMLLPSSRGHLSNTPFYEFELLARKTLSTAYIQVKSGDSNPLDLTAYASENKVFVFSAADYVGQLPPNVEIIRREDLLAFAHKFDGNLPFNLQIWMDFCRESGAAFA